MREFYILPFCFVFASLFYSYFILFHRFPSHFLLFAENMALAFELSMFSTINKPLLLVLVFRTV